MGLFNQAARSLPFLSLQVVITKLLAAIGFALIVRSLPTADIGAIGLSAGYLALIMMIGILPETAFVRDFLKIQKRVNEYISAFLWFGIYRSAALLLLGIPVMGYLYVTYPASPIWFYFLLIAFASFASGMASPFREAFYANFRQARVALVDSGVSLVSVLLLVFVWFTHDFIVYGFIQLIVALLSAWLWYRTARTHMDFHFILPKDWWTITWRSITDFTLWNQLIGTVSRLLYQADIVILGFFVSLGTLGPYSVALTLSNVFFVFPQLAQKLVTLSFSRVDAKLNAKALGLAVKYNTIVCLAQFVVFAIFGKWLVAFFGPAQPDQVLLYSLYLVGGVTMFNLSRPWLALAFAQMDNRKVLIELFVPLGIVGLVVYTLAAQAGGVVGVAQANVILYLVASTFSIIYVTHHLKVIPAFELITFQERKLFSETIQKWFTKKGAKS